MSRPRKLANRYHDNGDGTTLLSVETTSGKTFSTLIDTAIVQSAKDFHWYVDHRSDTRVYFRCYVEGRKLNYLHRMLAALPSDRRPIHHRRGTGSNRAIDLRPVTPREHSRHHRRQPQEAAA